MECIRPGDSGNRQIVDPRPANAVVADPLNQHVLELQAIHDSATEATCLLHDSGASLVVADIDEEKVARAAEEFGAAAAGLDEILFADADVIAPCALGAVLDADSIPRITAAIVAGGANNQLAEPKDGKRLADAGILYAPDYVINGGGIVNVACEYYGDVDDDGVTELVARIGPRLTSIFEEAAEKGMPTNEIADAQARRRIEAGS